jgi:hypothetical protein
MNAADRWEDARRIESWAGEVRVNLIRLAGILAFYGHHLVNVYFFRDDPSIRGQYHATVTALTLLWGGEVMVLYFCLLRRWVPPGLKYAATFTDLALITALLTVADTPRSPLVVLYFVVIASAPLRLSLRLVYAATLGAMVAYLFALGYYAFFAIGAERYYGEPNLRIPRTHEIILLLGLGAAGLLSGQVVRQVRRLVDGYSVAVGTRGE